MKRLVPVRVSLTVVAVLLVVFNSICTFNGQAPASDTVVMALLTLIGAAIAGDTLRPSGQLRGTKDPVTEAVQRIAEIQKRAGLRPPAPRMSLGEVDTNSEQKGG